MMPEHNLDQPNAFYKDLIDQIDQGYILVEVLFNEQDEPVDIYYIEANAAANRMTGISLAGKRTTELDPNYERHWYETFGRVAKTGIAEQYELSANPLGVYYRFHAFKVGRPEERKVAVIYLDITERREKEKALELSESRYRTLFETMSEGFCVIERVPGEQVDFRWIEGNPAFFVQAGRGDLIGRTMREVFPADAQDAILIYNEVFTTGASVRFEYEMPSLGFILELHAFKLHGTEEGKIAVLFQDITERKRAERLLMEKEQRQAYLLQLSDALQDQHRAAGLKDTACRVLSEHLGVTRAVYAERFLQSGTAFYQPAGQYAAATRLPADPVPADRYHAGIPLFNQGKVTVINDILIHIPEQEQHMYLQFDIRSFIATPLLRDEIPVLVLGVYDDKPRQWKQHEVDLVLETARRTWEAVQRANAEEALKEADRRKEEFLSILAHELRNPLAAVRNALTVLNVKGAPTDETEQLVAVMDRQVIHLVRMIDDLLDTRRISRGNMELKRELVNLGTLLEDAVEDIRPQFESHQRVLHFSPPGATLLVYGDTTRLNQVITNLLTNGLRYTKEQGAVWVSISREGQEAVIRISDNGIGIASEQLASIFEMFVQADHALARSQNGLGIGLTLVHQLVTLHEGRVQAFSEGLGCGSAFIIHLPLVEQQEQQKMQQEIAISDLPEQRSVLIIDDNEDGALTLSMVLRKKGFTVHTRPDGYTGMEAAEALRPTFVFCDISMPLIDGFETARRIREQTWSRDMLLIALTGYGQQEDKARAIQAGFDSFLTKPIQLHDLIRLLNDLQTNKGAHPDT